jgi:hypothetical protein
VYGVKFQDISQEMEKKLKDLFEKNPKTASCESSDIS